MNKLSSMYRRELANKRFIKETEQKQQNDYDIPDFSKDLNDLYHNEELNEENLNELYMTDQEETEIIEELIGIKNIEEEEKEQEEKVSINIYY